MIEARNITIGQKLNHKTKGEIEVLGITPHCGDYKIVTQNGWVYLKNCYIPDVSGSASGAVDTVAERGMQIKIPTAKEYIDFMKKGYNDEPDVRKSSEGQP